MQDNESDQSIVQLPMQPPVPILDEQPEIKLSQMTGLSRTRLALVLSDPSMDGKATAVAGLNNFDEMAAMPETGDGDVLEVEMDEEDIEDWEADLDEVGKALRATFATGSTLHYPTHSHRLHEDSP